MTCPTGPPSTTTFASGRRRGCGRKRFKPWSAGTGSEKGDPLPPAPWSWTASRWSRAKLVPCRLRKKGAPGKRWGEKGQRRKRQILTDTGGRLLKVFVHPANEHDKWGGRALLAGMDLSLWPRARKLFVDWGYRGLKETASSLGLELEVVARPYAGVRGVWVREGAEVPEIPRERGFKPLPKRWVVERTFAWLGRNRRLLGG
jgi:transposase